MPPINSATLAGTKVNENWTTVLREWADRPGLRQVERGYSRIVAGIARRVTKDPEQRRQIRKRAARPFRRPASGIELPAATRARLREIYTPHIRALEGLLGRSFGEWLR